MPNQVFFLCLINQTSYYLFYTLFISELSKNKLISDFGKSNYLIFLNLFLLLTCSCSVAFKKVFLSIGHYIYSHSISFYFELWLLFFSSKKIYNSIYFLKRRLLDFNSSQTFKTKTKKSLISVSHHYCFRRFMKNLTLPLNISPYKWNGNISF